MTAAMRTVTIDLASRMGLAELTGGAAWPALAALGATLVVSVAVGFWLARGRSLAERGARPAEVACRPGLSAGVVEEAA